MPITLSRDHFDFDQVRRAYLFADLLDQQFSRVSESARLLSLTDGECLFRQGAPATQFFLQSSGRTKLSRISAEGDEKVYEVVGLGDTFAEAVMFLGGNPVYPLTAAALGESRVCCFSCRDFLDVLRGSPDTCFHLMARMARRLHSQVIEIDRLTLHNATHRLVTYLLERLPEQVVGPPQVCLQVPKHLVASLLSIQPETFSRILSRLEEKGLLRVQDQTIVFLDLEGMRGLVRVAPD